MQVELTLEEVVHAASAGVRRNVRAIHHRRRQHRGFEDYNADRNWEISIEGALAEMAFAKSLGIYWADSAELDYHGDVGTYHVRSTAHEDGHLIVYPTDPDDAVFVLMIGRAQNWRVAGQINSSDARDEQWWRTNVRDPAFFVPQAALDQRVTAY